MVAKHTASRRQLFKLIGLLVLAASAGCSGDDGPANTLNRGIGTEPESFDAHKTQSVQAGVIFRDIGEGLATYAADGTLVQGAAASWGTSDDQLVYTFMLRENGRWSDGSPVTAEDFVFSFRRLVDPATAAPYVKSLENVVNAKAIAAGELPPDELGVRATGPLTLEITLAQPTPYFLSLLTHGSTFPQNAANIATHGDQHARPGTLITNGPYRLAAVAPGALIELERNPHYWNNANTAIDRVRYHVITEPRMEYNRFRVGELDITSTVPPAGFAEIQKAFPDALRVAPSLGVYYYGLNVTKPPFKDNPALREALSLAIDREAIAEKIVGRGELPAWSFVPPGLSGYTSPQLTFDGITQEERNERARRLYRDAGFSEDNPARFELRYNTSEEHRRIAVAVVGMWEEVLGAEVELANVEFRVLLSQMYARDVTQVFRSAWNADYADPHAFLSILESNNPQNLPGWSNPEFDDRMSRAGEQADATLRARFLEEAERVLLADYAVIPLYFYVSKHLVSPQVLSWEDSVLDYHYSHHLRLEEEDSEE